MEIRVTKFSKILLIFVLTAVISAQGISIPYVGNKAYAMGGAYRAVADDYSAFYWNPAGLANINSQHFGLSMLHVMPSASLDPDDVLYQDVKKTDVEPRTFQIPTAGWFMNSGGYTFGVGLNVPFGLGATWDLLPDAPYASHGVLPQNEYESDLSVINIQPTFAHKVNENFSYGVGVMLFHSHITIAKPAYTPLDEINSGLATAMRNAVGEEAYNSYFRDFWVNQKLEGKGFGFGLNAGFTFNINEKLTIAGQARWYNAVTLEGNANAGLLGKDFSNSPYEAAILAVNDPSVAALFGSDEANFGGVTGAQFIGTAYKDGYLAALKKDQYTAMFDDEIEAVLNLPIDFGVGLSYKFTEKFTAAVDYSYTMWRSLDRIDINFATAKAKDENGDLTNNPYTSELDLQWKDSHRISVGFDYKATQNLELMAGGYFAQTPTNDKTFNPSIPDLTDRFEISFGTKYSLNENLAVEFSGATIQFGERKISNDNKYNDDNLSGTYTGSALEIAGGFIYNF
jgi:long-chain fatty acid transport protein